MKEKIELMLIDTFNIFKDLFILIYIIPRESTINKSVTSIVIGIVK